MLTQKGFSLVEMLSSVVISCVIMLSALSLLPFLQNNLLNAYHRYHLNQTVTQYVLAIEKDLRRIGFVASKNAETSHPFYTFETTPPCLTILYDYQRNGYYILSSGEESSIFRYRLRNKAIEYNRGAQDCVGKNWKSISDANEIIMTAFEVEAFEHYFRVSMSAHRKTNAKIAVQVTRFVRRENG